MQPNQYENLLKRAEFISILQAEIGKDMADMRALIAEEGNKTRKELYQAVDRCHDRIDRTNDRIDKLADSLRLVQVTMVIGFLGVVATIICSAIFN
jgi:hypothetical protein